MWKQISISIFLLGILSSFNYHKPRLREGYYFWAFGHTSTLYKIDGDKIEWFNDNVVKKRGQGKYIIVDVDSVIKISYDKIWISSRQNQEVKFETSLKIKWNKANGILELDDYQYREKSDAIEAVKKRVKTSSKLKVIR